MSISSFTPNTTGERIAAGGAAAGGAFLAIKVVGPSAERRQFVKMIDTTQANEKKDLLAFFDRKIPGNKVFSTADDAAERGKAILKQAVVGHDPSVLRRVSSGAAGAILLGGAVAGIMNLAD